MSDNYDGPALAQKILRQQAEIERLRARLAEAERDAERLNWLDSMKYMGYGLISDDNGHYAVSVTGIQNVPMTDEPCDIQTTFFVEAAEWKDSARDAIDAAMRAPDSAGPNS